MKNNKALDLISHKNFREKFLGSKKYPGFQARMIATLIDFTIVSIVFMPFFAVFGGFIYDDAIPQEMINKAIQEVGTIKEKTGKNIDFFTFIKNNPEYYEYFYKENGFVKMILEQIARIISLAIMIFIFWKKKQATPGKMCLSMKIVDATTLKKPTTKQLVIRLFSYIISIIPLLLGIFWIAFDKKKQGWHDKIANTLVVRTEKKKKQ